jgi:hypothetical protein
MAAKDAAADVDSSSSFKDKAKRPPRAAQMTWMSSVGIQFLVHLFCLSVYLIPIFQPNQYSGPTLDELHIMSSDNHDIQGDSTLKQIFTNDYWGRPMQSESSHKSWRPLTVLSFRHLKGIFPASQLTMHRCVNILTHAAAAEIIGILAIRLTLFQQPTQTQQQRLLLRMITKIVFILHPTHVEVTANAANRNHVLAILFSMILCDPTCPILLFGLAILCGFLCSETFLFQIPAAMVTLVVIRYYSSSSERRKKAQTPQTLFSIIGDYLYSAVSVLPRLFFMILSIGIYLGGRAYFDTLNIPEGLIRPAENPFYHFEGEHRVRNYLYTLGVHIAKSWGMDPVGFSHEYGFDCIPAIEDWQDPRLALPYGICVALLVSLVLAFSYPQTLLGPVAIHWAWLLTLFPISGLVKVGTFISDRIVVASTVSVSLWIGLALYWWATQGIQRLPAKPLQMLFVGWLFAVSYMKVHTRSLQWMDSISLLESSLKTCPRFAKGHMEMSKIYSGLYPNLSDLRRSRQHLEIAREIDPDLCDTHQQFAHVAIQQGKYLEYEEELTQAVLCTFSSGGALPMWQHYWKVAMNSASSPEQQMEVQERQNKYTRIIQEAVAEAQRKEAEQIKKKDSPIVGWGPR